MTLHVPFLPPGPAASSGEGTSLSVSVDPRSGCVIVAGELDREHAPQVLDALVGLAPSGHAHWTVDARPVTFCDAGGLRTLVLAHRLAVGRERTLSILPSPCMHRLVLLVGLDHVLGTPPAPPTVPAGVAGSRRARRSPAAVRDLRRPSSPPGATAAAG